MIHAARVLAPLVLAGSLAACAGSPSSSYVALLAGPTDAQIIAGEITEFVALSLPATSTTLALEAPVSEHASNALTPALTASLRRRGFATVDVEGENTPAGARRMRYRVTPMDEGDLVRLTIDGGAIQSSRFLARNTAGQLQPGGPFTVLGVERVILPVPEPAPRRVARRRGRGAVMVGRPVVVSPPRAGVAL